MMLSINTSLEHIILVSQFSPFCAYHFHARVLLARDGSQKVLLEGPPLNHITDLELQFIPSFQRSATNLSEDWFSSEVTLSFRGSMFFVSQAVAL